MKIEYKIQASDFLDFQLFTASKSKRIMNKKVKGRIFLTLASVISGIYFYSQNHMTMSIYFGLVALIIGVFYPKYFHWRYQKHITNYIKENYKQRFGEIENLEITKEYIYSKDKTGEGKIKIKEVENVSETKNHFFLKISTGMSLIIPKRAIKNIELLKDELNGIGLTVIDELNWKWE